MMNGMKHGPGILMNDNKSKYKGEFYKDII